MTAIIEAIKAKIDVVEEISLVVVLQKSGKSFKGLCPFHNERSPSFYIFVETQTWRCFGCNEGGDLFTFVQKQQGFTFREALHYLAEKAGIVVDSHSRGSSEEQRAAGIAKERLRKMNGDALLWFHHMLLRSKEAEEARTYVQSRDISTDTVISFSLGYAPDQWGALSSYLLAQGYAEDELVTGGLARRRGAGDQGNGGDGNGMYDCFRDRLIFPIWDMQGRVIGFGGRALGDGKPKYINSSQTPLFEKNSVLYAIDRARDPIKHSGQVVIVEGYVDAIIAHQYGTRQTVACIGSAITEKHIQQLKKLTRQVILALDPDDAGNAATEQGIQEALRTFDRIIVPIPLAVESGKGSWRGQSRQPRGIIRLEEQVDAEIKVLQLPPGEDPDEVIRRDLSAWLYALEHPLPLIDFYFVAKTANLNLQEPHDKTEATRRLLPIIGTISNRIKRDLYIRRLASMIHADERSLYGELQKVLREQRTGAVTASFSAPLENVRQHGHQEASSVSASEDEEHQSSSNNKHLAGGLDRNRDNKLQWEDYLIGLLLQNPELSPYVCGIINDGDFAGTDTRELYHILNSVYQQRASSPSLQSVEQAVPSELLVTVARVQKYIESRSPKDGSGLVKEVIQCATRLKRTRLLQLNTELRYLISEATSVGNSGAVRQLSLRLSELYRELRTIDSAMHLHG